MEMARRGDFIVYLLLLVLFMVCMEPAQGTIEFNYKCDGKGATVSTYSYLKEPRIEEYGIERGLKSGSFNYLEEGDLTLEESISYYYGNSTNKSNSSLNHAMNVDFKGEKGISEFFGRGYFGNNRYLSAWKKIRYEETPNIKVNNKNWTNRSSNNIEVRASVYMNTTKGTDYDFKYNAKVKDGVIEAKDAVGWTNRTGPRKYDWEYHSLSSGDQLDITNDLSDYEPFEVAAGLGDWLPCCFSGTVPMVDQNDSGWPSPRVIATLEANKLLPTKGLSAAFAIPSSDSPTYWKREIQIGLSSRPSVPVQKAEVSVIDLSHAGSLKVNGLLPTKYSSVAYATPLSSSPVYWKREAQIGLRSLLPNVMLSVPLQKTANNSSLTSESSQDIANSSISPSVPLQNSANCIGDNCPANFFASKKQKDLTCKEGACDGYECIYTYDDEAASTGATTIPQGSTRNIDVTLDVYEAKTNTTALFMDNENPESAKYEIYKITVHNNGDVTLENVILSADLAKNMMFVNTSYFDKNRGKVDVTVEPVKFAKDKVTNVVWKLGSLASDEIKSVIMAAYIKPEVDNKAVVVRVKGNAIDGLGVTDSQNGAEIRNCSLKLPNNQPCYVPSATCKLRCPDWIYSFSP